MVKSEYVYSWIPGGPLFTQNTALIDEMASLYANHYGVWSQRSPRNPGQRIKLSASRIKKWISSDDSILAAAYQDGALIGYAIAVRTKAKLANVKNRTISWVTQFVIHSEHRNRGVGRNLLFAIWGFSDHFAWGIVTASPYAVRALEKATRRRCVAGRIARNRRKLLGVGAKHVPYITRDIIVSINPHESKVDTEFYVDHSELGAMLQNVTTTEKPWLLGPIEEGWEWFAFTFQDQEQIGLTAAEIEAMLKASDDVVKQAYSCMPLGSASQKWAQYSEPEATFIADACRLPPGSSVLDFGCGPGRHAIELAATGFHVTGVDYIPRFNDEARERARSRHVDATWIVGDCRDIALADRFDLVICLYDVIGSYADDLENARIVRNISAHLKIGGKALISVMNYGATERRAKMTFNIKSEANKLLALPASQTMERTGDIFNPDYLMIDTEARVVYVRDQSSWRP
jgi:2-polyprenyl-3-methyl-5-hydroxy-6-metoxy-1,4-benzoquinol methylase/GNAT superfamily N-acetyltransferase